MGAWGTSSTEESIRKDILDLQRIFYPTAVVTIVWTEPDDEFNWREFSALGQLGKVGDPGMANFVIENLSFWRDKAAISMVIRTIVNSNITSELTRHATSWTCEIY